MRAHPGIDRFWREVSPLPPGKNRLGQQLCAQRLGSWAPNLEHCLLPIRRQGYGSPGATLGPRSHCPQKKTSGAKTTFHIKSSKYIKPNVRNHWGFNSQSLLTKTFLNKYSKISVLNEKKM